MIRKAAQMTQAEVARKLGVGQGAVTVHGQRIELDLSQLRSHPGQKTA